MTNPILREYVEYSFFDHLVR